MIFFGIGLFLSFTGYFYVIYRHLHFSWYTIPIFISSMISIGTYVGGLANLLLPVSYCIYLLGILGFMYMLTAWIKQGLPKIHIEAFPILFIIGTIIFFLLTINLHLQHYDNFSHWAIIVKYLLTANSFPNAATAMISFKEYPLAASSFIYYICLFLGHSQGVMLLAQNILIFSCMLSVFGIIQEKNRFLLYIFLAFGMTLLSILNITIRINNLLVDFLLPMCTLSAIAIIYIYKDQLSKTMLCLIPLLAMTNLLKSTGLIFSSIALCFFAYTLIRDKKYRNLKTMMLFLLFIIITLIPYILWNYHLDSIIQGATKFSTTNISSEFIKLPASMYSQVISKYLSTIFSFQNRSSQMLFLYEIVSISVIIFYKVKYKKNLRLTPAYVWLNVVVILYYIGILGLYLFSMPYDEAIYLAGFERYACSIVILFGGGLFIAGTLDIEDSFYIKLGNQKYDYKAFYSPKTKQRYQKAVLVFAILALNLLYSEFNGLLSIESQYETSLPGKISSLLGDEWPENGQTNENHYLLITNDSDAQISSYYVHYTAKYFLYSPYVDATNTLDEGFIKNELKKYDYIIVLEPEESTQQVLLNQLSIQTDGVYSINELTKEMQ